MEVNVEGIGGNVWEELRDSVPKSRVTDSSCGVYPVGEKRQDAMLGELKKHATGGKGGIE